MDDNKKVTDDLNNFLSEHNIAFSDLVEMYGSVNQALLLMPPTAQELYDKQFAILRAQTDEKYKTTKDKGSALENLVYTMFTYGENPLLKIARNCHTSTNEIDLLLDWTDHARKSCINRIYSELQDPFICECKYYKNNVSVTYIGKFYSLLKASDTRIGLFFTWNGVTGKSEWSDAKGLIKKIALKDNIFILVFTYKDYQMLLDGKKCIFSMIHDKYVCLIQDIDYDKYISSHENEQILNRQ